LEWEVAGSAAGKGRWARQREEVMETAAEATAAEIAVALQAVVVGIVATICPLV